MRPTKNSCTSSVFTLIKLDSALASDSDTSLLRWPSAMADHVADRSAARAGADIGLSGQELLDSLRQWRRLHAASAGLVRQRLVPRLVLMLLKGDWRPTPRAELRRTGGHGQQIRGSGSPASMSTTRLPPKAVSSSTMPGGSDRTSPTMA